MSALERNEVGEDIVPFFDLIAGLARKGSRVNRLLAGRKGYLEYAKKS